MRWITGKLSDLVEINPPIKLVKGKEYPFVSMDVINPGKKIVEAKEYRNFSGGGARFQNNDTLFARITPCLENGKIAQVRNLDGGVGFGSTEFLVFRGKKGITDTEFVHYFVTNHSFRAKAIQLMVGTSGRQRVDHKKLSEEEFTIPPLSIQRKIAEILGSLDDKIELNRRMNETLEQMAMALYKHWFVDFGPFQDGEFVEIEDFTMPKGWKIAKVGDLGDVVTGKTPTTKDPENFGNDIPFITIPDMHNKTFIVSTERRLSFKGANSQASKFVPPYSICVSCIATPGLVAITSQPSQTNQQINTVVCSSENLRYFAYLTLKNMSSTIRTLGSGGSATLNLNKRDFCEIRIVLPPNDVLERFHQTVNYHFDQILQNEMEILTLQELRDYLLPRLLSGEIEVREAEEHVEEVLANA